VPQRSSHPEGNKKQMWTLAGLPSSSVLPPTQASDDKGDGQGQQQAVIADAVIDPGLWEDRRALPRPHLYASLTSHVRHPAQQGLLVLEPGQLTRLLVAQDVTCNIKT
jgi:hypothetical protein